MADLGEHSWRRAREKNEFEIYMQLRRRNQETGFPYNDRQMREQARLQANKSAELAIAMHNEQATA